MKWMNENEVKWIGFDWIDLNMVLNEWMNEWEWIGFVLSEMMNNWMISYDFFGLVGRFVNLLILLVVWISYFFEV